MAVNPVAVQFTGDAKAFFAEMSAVRKELGGVSDSFSQLKKIAAGALAGFSIGAFTGFVRAAAAAADQLGATADKLGLGTEALTAFQVAAKDAGVSLEATNKLLLESQKRLGAAASDTGAAAKYIKTLGLNVAELQKLSPDELFSRYADAISQLENRSERFAAAQALFGKSAEEAFILIERGRPALEAARETVDRYGLALSRVDVEQIKQANDRLELLGRISQTAGQRIAAGLAPFVSAVADSLLEAAGNTEGLQRKAEMFGAVAYTAFQVVANAARALEAAFFGIAAAGAKVLQTLTFGSVSEAFAASVDANVARAQSALDRIQSIEQIQQGIIKAMEDARAEAARAVREQQDRPKGTETVAAGPESTGPSAAFLAFERDLQLREKLNQEAESAADKLADEMFQREMERIRLQGEAFLEDQAEKRRAAEETERYLQQFRADGIAAAESLMNHHNAKLRAIGKAAFLYQKAQALAQAVINTREAVTMTYAKLGYPWGVPAAFAVAAIGAAQIASIVSTNPGASTAQVTAGGGAPVGNPVYRDEQNEGQRGVSQQPSVQLIIHGNVYADDLPEKVIEAIDQAVNGRDAVIIKPNSRQAISLRTEV